MSEPLFSFRAVKNPVVLVAIAAIGIVAILHCARNNPLDEKGTNFIPGSAPEARFIRDTVKAYINNQVDIPVFFSDTAAKGGRAPLVTTLLFNWEGDSTRIHDSSAVPGDSVVRRVFTRAIDTVIYMKAKDNDGELSPSASMRLIILEGRPRILALTADPLSAYIGDTVSVTATATDDNIEPGDSLDFIWSVDNNKDTITRSGYFRVGFMSPGIHKVLVQVRDRDSIRSLPDSVMIDVRSRPVLVDTVDPEITFVSPASAITVNVPLIAIVINIKDESGVSLVYINNQPATLAGGTVSSSTWKRDTVPLVEGANVIPVLAVDNKMNSSDTTITVTYNKNAEDLTPPDITPLSPKQGDIVYFSMITVLAEVRDAAGKVDQVTCNGRQMVLSEGSVYAADSVALDEGLDTITISAQDDKGNRSSRDVIITYKKEVVDDTIAPSVLVLSPRNGARVETRACTVSVAASDLMSGIDSVNVNGLRAAHIGGQIFARAIQLAHGANTIFATAFDKSGNSKSDTVIVIQDASPVFDLAVKDTAMTVDVEASFSVRATDPDNDSLSFSFLTFPFKASTRPLLTRNGSMVTIAPYLPDQTGVDSFKVLVTDPYAAFDTVTIRVFITSMQETMPFFTTTSGDLPDSATAGAVYAAQLAAVDPNGKPLVFSLKKPPTPQSALIDSLGSVAWTPLPADTGRDSLYALVTNGTESDTLIWTVWVTMPNLAPVLVDPPDTVIDEGVRIRITLHATDPNGDQLTYSMSSFPAGAQLAGPVFTWTPSFSQAGVYSVMFRATETNRTPPLRDSQTVTITVRNVNHAPVLAPIGPLAANELALLTITLSASDTNGDSIRFSMINPPQGAAITPLTKTTARFSWTPAGSQAGTYGVSFLAADNGSPVMRDSETVTITVHDTTPPVFVTDSLPDTVFVGNTYLDTVRATDADSDPIVYQKLSGPSWLTVGAGSGVLTGAPEPSEVTPGMEVKITAEDPVGLKDTVTWTITVLPMWPRVWGDATNQDTAFSVCAVSGGFALCGHARPTSSQAFVPFFIRTDANGNPLPPKNFFVAGSKRTLYSMAQASDGGFILCGTDSGAAQRMLIIKTDTLGDTSWTARYSINDVVGLSTKGASVFATSEGGFVAAGAALRQGGGSTANSSVYVVKANSAGTVEWQREYSSTALDNPVAYCIQQTSDNGYVVCGTATTRGGMATDNDVLLIRTDSKGDTVWIKTWSRGPKDFALSVRQVTDGFIIGGYSVGTLNSNATGFVAKVTDKGDTAWTMPITSAGGSSLITSVRNTPDGGFIAAGSVVNATGGGEDALLIKFSAEGKEEWRKMYGGPLGDRANTAAVLSEGEGMVFAGFTTRTINNLTSTDVYLVKTDASGNVVEK